MGRPGEWSLLGYGSDPVDADLDEIEAEADHYELMADAITSQVATLRHLATDGVLVGDYADAIRDSCDDLAGNLQKAEGRFRTVADELSGLVGPLEDALTETASALVAARSAQESIDSAENQGYDPRRPLAAQEEPESGPSLQVLATRHESASGSLSAARTRAQNAVARWNDVAEAAARRIRDASDDDMKDGRFEGFKAWVRANADLLRSISTWLGRIVLVITVAILIFGSGGLLLFAAVALGLALLTVDTVLAVAGEGSWTDVAFSALGVLTLGTGSLLGRLARSGRAVTAARAGRAQGLRSGMQTLRNSFNNPGLRGGLTNVRNAFRPSTYTNALDDGRRVAQALRGSTVTQGPILRARNLVSGRDSLSLADDLAELGQLARPALRHRLGVTAGLRHTEVATGAAYVDGALDELQGRGVDLGGIDRRTTREVSSL